MTGCHPSPFPISVLLEATEIAPKRRRTSDGICGDATHRAEVSDHNPDARGIPHAVDISQSTPTAPFWLPSYALFDAHAYGWEIARRIIAGTEHRVKYLVSFNGQVDVIFDPAVSLTWRQNGAPKQDHASHLHVSFLSGTTVENSTAPFFEPQPSEEPVTKDEIEAVADRTADIVMSRLVTAHPDGTHSGVLTTEIKRYTDPILAAVEKLPRA